MSPAVVAAGNAIWTAHEKEKCAGRFMVFRQSHVRRLLPVNEFMACVWVRVRVGKCIGRLTWFK
jgi:hypothetical protein